MKKFAAAFVSIVMLITLCLPISAFAAGEILDYKLEIQNFKAEIDTEVSSLVKISGQYINKGKSTIYNLSVGVDGDFAMMNGSGGFIGNLTPGYSDQLNLMVVPTGKGICKGTIVFTYEDSLGNAKSEKKDFNVNITSGNNTSGGITGGGNTGGTDTEDKQDAELYVSTYATSVLQAGSTTDFPMKVDVKDYYANKARMSLTGPEGDYKNGFSFVQSTAWYDLGDVIDVKSITPRLKIGSNVPDGRYVLTVNFEYKDGYGNAFTSKSEIVVTVFGKSQNAPYIQSAKFNVAEIGKENKAKLSVNIFNPMINDMLKVNVALNATASEGFSLYENFRPVVLETIGVGKTGSAVFSMYVSKDTGNYPLSFDISYETPDGEIHTSTETVWVEVNRVAGAGTDKASRPRIIIQSYETDVEMVEAGKEFTLSFTLQNTSGTEAVSNIKVVLGSVTAQGSGGQNTASSDVFFPASGSNSFFIEKIAPKGSTAQTIKLMTSQSVEPGVYPVKLDISYDSENAHELTSDEQISFPVTQQQRLEIQNFQAGADTMMGNPVQVSGQYINMGKSTIYNFSIAVDGSFTMMEGYGGYIGNLTSGYNDQLDLMVIPTAEGECTGSIVFNYEDSQGTQKSMKKDITVNVMPMGGGEDIGGMMPGGDDSMPGMTDDVGGAQEGMPLWLIITLCAGGVVVVAAIVILAVVIRKKRRAKELVEDEED